LELFTPDRQNPCDRVYNDLQRLVSFCLFHISPRAVINVLSAADVKDVAADVIGQLPLRGIEGSPLDSGDIRSVVTLAWVTQSSVWKITSQTDDTPCDDTAMDWRYTLQREKLEMAAALLSRHLAMTILETRRFRGTVAFA
jgi:hypothetical protein